MSTAAELKPEFRAELLNRLGLPPMAGPGHVEAAYRSAVTLLDRLPESEATWAAGQRAELDAIRSLLLDGTAAAAKSPAQTNPAAGRAASAADSATVSRASSARTVEPNDQVARDAQPVEYAAAFAEPAQAPEAAGRGRRPRARLLAAGIIGLVLVGGGGTAFAVMQHNSAVPGITGKPTNTANPSASSSLDMVQVAALMKKIAANPKDSASLMALSGLYFQAGDYTNSAHFSQEVVAIDPKNDTAQVALGAALFNAGKNADAKVAWDKAIALNPKNAEAYYDLGFYYLSGSTPDLAKVRAAWQQVIKINPASDLAKTVSTHLNSLNSAGATPQPSGK